MARFVVVACDVVALSAVKFCKVVEPVARMLLAPEKVTRPESV